MNRQNVMVLAAVALVGVAVFLITPTVTLAAAQPPQTAAIFLEIDGIVGASADAQHKDSIEVQSFSLAGQNQGSEGKATLSDAVRLTQRANRGITSVIRFQISRSRGSIRSSPEAGRRS